jgi:AcrR family transcriptional regulator
MYVKYYLIVDKQYLFKDKTGTKYEYAVWSNNVVSMSRINAEYRSDYREGARKRIIAAALDVAEKNGWDAVTLDAIAQQIGVSKPALYSYFGNREELLHEVVLEVTQNMHNVIETIVTRDDDIRAFIRNLAGLLFEQQKTYASIFFLLPTRQPHDPGYREEFVHIFDSSRVLIRDCLARAKAAGKLAQDVNPDTAAFTIIAMSMGLLTSSEFLEMDTGTAKTIWMEAVERALLIGTGGGK